MYTTLNDHWTRAKWLINRYGQSRALLQARRYRFYHPTLLTCLISMGAYIPACPTSITATTESNTLAHLAAHGMVDAIKILLDRYPTVNIHAEDDRVSFI